MGIRLATVALKKQRILWKAALYFVISFAFFFVNITMLLMPLPPNPAQWLLQLIGLLMPALFFFVLAIITLGKLQHVLEFYENAISYGKKEIPLEQILLVSFERQHRRSLFSFWRKQPLCCIYYDTQKHSPPENEESSLSPEFSPGKTLPKHVRRLKLWTEDFTALEQSFIDAYEHSLPERFFTK